MTAYIHEGRGNQHIYGKCAQEECADMRAFYNGGVKDRDVCYDERNRRKDEVIALGSWRLIEGSNGSMYDLHMMRNATEFMTRSTVEIQGGPWVFERCDVRSIMGICIWGTREDMSIVPPGDCLRQRDGKGPENRLRVVEDENVIGAPSSDDDEQDGTTESEMKQPEWTRRSVFVFVFVSVFVCCVLYVCSRNEAA